MAKGRGRPPVRGGAGSDRGGDGAGVGKVLLGVLLGGAAVAGGSYLYRHTAPGARTVERGEPTAPAKVLRAPESPRAEAARPPAGMAGKAAAGASAGAGKLPPFGASEDVFEAGAAVYLQRCAKCHGTVRRDAAGPNGQRAAQLFRAGRQRAAEQTPEQVFAAINLGAQGLGMPAYHGILTDQQIWQLVLLLRSAAEPLPDPVVATLDGGEAR